MLPAPPLATGRVFVDDAELEASHALEEPLAAVAAGVDPLSLGEVQMEEAEQQLGQRPQQSAQAAQGELQRQAQPRLWHHRVALEQVAQVGQWLTAPASSTMSVKAPPPSL